MKTKTLNRIRLALLILGILSLPLDIIAIFAIVYIAPMFDHATILTLCNLATALAFLILPFIFICVYCCKELLWKAIEKGDKP